MFDYQEMKMLMMIAVIIAGLSANGAEIRCLGRVDHMIVEEVHPDSGFPTAIPQDKASGPAKNRKYEWTYLNNQAGLAPVVAHCYSSKDDSKKVDLKIPFEKKRCVLEKQSFFCP